MTTQTELDDTQPGGQPAWFDFSPRSPVRPFGLLGVVGWTVLVWLLTITTSSWYLCRPVDSARLGPDLDLSTQCAPYVSHDSPVMRQMGGLSYRMTAFNGSWSRRTVFRHPPSPTVDAAWDSLGINYRPVVLSPHEAAEAGIAADQVHVRPKYGGGYIANVEGLHHLHCLDLIRQAVYFNEPYYRAQNKGGWVNAEAVLVDHITHCIDILRQQLMCTVDVGLMGQIWWAESSKQHPTPFVDFNTNHRCRDFDAIRKWAYRRQSAENPPSDFVAPPRPHDRVYRSIP